MPPDESRTNNHNEEKISSKNEKPDQNVESKKDGHHRSKDRENRVKTSGDDRVKEHSRKNDGAAHPGSPAVQTNGVATVEKRSKNGDDSSLHRSRDDRKEHKERNGGSSRHHHKDHRKDKDESRKSSSHHRHRSSEHSHDSSRSKSKHHEGKHSNSGEDSKVKSEQSAKRKPDVVLDRTSSDSDTKKRKTDEAERPKLLHQKQPNGKHSISSAF